MGINFFIFFLIILGIYSILPDEKRQELLKKLRRVNLNNDFYLKYQKKLLKDKN